MQTLTRKERRAAEHQARKAARKSGFPNNSIPTQNQPVEAAEPSTTVNIPEPGAPFPSYSTISPAQLEANRRNAQLSTGPLSATTRAISAQNHTIHGLARHENGAFRLLTTEDPEAFAHLKQGLLDEHQPATATESLLVKGMAEASWLSQRAQRLQDTCLHPDTGHITDEKKFKLYLRYFTTHNRVFHKCLQDLTKLRAEKRKAEIGFEAQRIKNEQNEMKKAKHYWEVLHKDAVTCHQISLNTSQNLKARAENPNFQAEYDAELAKHGLHSANFEVAQR